MPVGDLFDFIATLSQVNVFDMAKFRVVGLCRLLKQECLVAQQLIKEYVYSIANKG